MIRVAIGEWAPYTSEHDPKGKMLETLFREAMSMHGHEVEFFYFPWARSKELVLQGRYDVTFPWYLNNELKEAFHVTPTPMMREKEVFFALKKTHFDWKSISDLKKYRVGGTLGYSHVATFEQAGIHVETSTDELHNFSKLEAGRIDVYPSSYIVGNQFIRELFGPEELEKFKVHPKPLRDDPMFALFSKKTQNGMAYAAALDDSLKRLIESGRYKELVKPGLPPP